jgi:phosphatidylglycerol---prolipoprotein diacylglyceryl transferase
MFYHTINPDLLTLGPFHIRFYGIVYALGFLIAYFILQQLAKKEAIKNFTVKDVEMYLLFLVLGVIVGARLFEIIFYDPAYYFSQPLKMLYIWEGGLSFHGGLVGAFLVTYLYCKKKKTSFYDLADVLVLPTAVMLGFGRIANFINGELYGTKTTVAWCVDYSKNQYLYNPPDGCRHPSQLYESAKNFFIFFVLLSLHARKKLFPKGFLFWLFIFLYGLLRFMTNFWRDDPRWFGLSMGQYLSLVMMIIALPFLVQLWKYKKKKG